MSNYPQKKYPPRDPSVPFKQKPDSGNLHATQSKLSDISPDYFGELAINPKDMTAVRVEDGMHIYKISGWKVKSPSGKTYLNIKLNRYVPDGAPKPAPVSNDLPDDDLDF